MAPACPNNTNTNNNFRRRDDVFKNFKYKEQHQKKSVKDQQGFKKVHGNFNDEKKTILQRKMRSLMPIPYGDPLGLYELLGLKGPNFREVDTSQFQEASNNSRYESQKFCEPTTSSSTESLEKRFKNMSLNKGPFQKIRKCESWRLQNFGNQEDTENFECSKDEGKSKECGQNRIN